MALITIKRLTFIDARIRGRTVLVSNNKKNGIQ